MLSYIPKLYQNQKTEGAQGGPPAPPPPTPPKQQEAAPVPPPNPSSTQTEGYSDADFGYEAHAAEEKKGDPPAPGYGKEETPPVPPESTEVKDPATGYGAEPPKVDAAPPAPPAAPVTPPVTDDMDKALGELPKEELGKIKEFMTTHKVAPETAKAYADLRRDEIKAAQKWSEDQGKERDRQIAQMKADWYKELKDDKDFGGENFSKSTQAVERIMQDLMPSTKKRLTETKGMLPPYLMRDLAKVAETLYKNPNLVRGEPPAPKAPETEDSPLDFYV